jgi:ATP-dependent Clp protease protease subunit
MPQMSASPPTKEIWFAFAGAFDNSVSNRFFNNFAGIVKEQYAHAHLLIQSAGGVVGDGIAVYNFLRTLPLHLTTYNVGAVESIAVLPYLAGKHRRATKNSTFLIHKSSPPMPARATADHLRKKAADSDIYDQNFESILRLHLDIPDDKWEIHRTSDLLISTDDALQFKLVHEIVDFAPLPGLLYSI